MRTPRAARRAMMLTAAALTVAAGACDGMPGGPLPVKTARSSKLRVEKPLVPTADADSLRDGNSAFALSLFASLSAQPGN
ncbi:MAG TPA: hypothetical protein VNO55_20500, partial [Polyangia bacterium]|nr:hypothetical protein [Polyangia bacterium]